MITQKDIAKALNISTATVSRALNNGKILSETRVEILKKAKEMGYIENPNAISLALKSDIVIEAFIFNSLVDQYSEEIIRGLNKFQEDKKNSKFRININILDADFNFEKRSEKQIEEILKKIKLNKPKGILFSSIGIIPSEKILENCKINKVICGTFDMLLKPNSSAFHVGPNYYKLGKAAGELLAKFMRKKGNVLILNFDEGYGLSSSRIKGFLEEIKKYKNIKVLPISNLKSLSKLEYEKIVEKNLKEFQIDGVFPIYRSEYLAEIFKELNLDIPLISNDFNDKVNYFLKKGNIDAIISQNPFEIGFYSGKMFYDLFFLNKQKIREEKEIELKILIKNNII
ncbi:MAG: substrate-binding domain-containing protein [Fusobacteriaceae bacterium]